jgi:hypothetical protein
MSPGDRTAAMNRKREEPPARAAQPKRNRMQSNLTPPPRRRGPWPNRDFRDLQRLGPAALEAFVSFRQIGRTA